MKIENEDNVKEEERLGCAVVCVSVDELLY